MDTKTFEIQDSRRLTWVTTFCTSAEMLCITGFSIKRCSICVRALGNIGGTPKSCFVFTGLLKCGMCGHPLQICNGTGRHKKIHNYYACLAHKNGKMRCCLKFVRAEAFDAWLIDEILGKVLTINVVQKVVDEIRAYAGR